MPPSSDTITHEEDIISIVPVPETSEGSAGAAMPGGSQPPSWQLPPPRATNGSGVVQDVGDGGDGGSPGPSSGGGGGGSSGSPSGGGGGGSPGPSGGGGGGG